MQKVNARIKIGAIKSKRNHNGFDKSIFSFSDVSDVFFQSIFKI